MTRLCRLEVKVTVHGHVCSISPLPLEGFSINFGQVFNSVRCFAESITGVRRLEFKVTIKGNGIKPCISGQLLIYFTSGRIFIKLWSNVSEMVCRTHESDLKTQGKGHWINFVSTLYVCILGTNPGLCEPKLKP